MAIGDQLQTIAPGDKLILDARSNVVGIQGGHNSGEPLRLPGFIELVTADDTLIKRSNGGTKVNTTASTYTLTIAKNMPEGYGLCGATGA